MSAAVDAELLAAELADGSFQPMVVVVLFAASHPSMPFDEAVSALWALHPTKRESLYKALCDYVKARCVD